MDTKGLGRPPTFGTSAAGQLEAKFRIWPQKTENFIVSVYPEARELLRESAEEMNEVDIVEFKGHSDVPEDVVDEVNEQTFACLCARL